MFDGEPADLDAATTLTEAAEVRAVADRAEVRLLELAAHWADLHGQLDPADDGVSLPGMERLVRLGGEGTALVAEFAPAELGAVLGISAWSAGRLVGAAVDLRHRLPKLWAATQAGQVRPWIARKSAEATRDLDPDLVRIVDRRLTRWAPSLGWGRLAALIEAAVIEADPAAADAAARRVEHAQGVWLGRSSKHGIKDIYIRTETANAIWFDASIDRIADNLAALGDTASKDVRRGRAVGILAHPQRALDLCQPTNPDTTPTTAPRGNARPPRPCMSTSTTKRSPNLVPLLGVAWRGLEGEGPITVEQARRWLGHCQVTVKPVLDLADQTPVDAYEIPDRLRDTIHLRNPVDVFPYAANTSRPPRHRPHRPLPTTRPRRPTRTNQGGQPRPDDPLPPPDQNPQPLAAPTTLPRRLPLALTPRPPLPGGPHRNSPEHAGHLGRASSALSCCTLGRARLDITRGPGGGPDPRVLRDTAPGVSAAVSAASSR
jgi:hypothetical protein